MSVIEAGLETAGKVAEVVGKVVDRKNARDAREGVANVESARVDKIEDAHDPEVKSMLARWGYVVRLRLSRPGVPDESTKDGKSEGGGTVGSRDSVFKRVGDYLRRTRGGAK